MPLTFSSLRAPKNQPPLARLRTGNYQFDRAFGGGIPRESSALIAGDPGAGKSTLLLQVASALALRLASQLDVARSHPSTNSLEPDRTHLAGPVVYLSGEEPTAAIQARAARLNLSHAPLLLAQTSDVFEAVDSLTSPPLDQPPSLVVWDSVQRFRDPARRAEPGSPSQTLAVVRQIRDFCHDTGAASLIVCHVVKAGDFAGVMGLQHDVDATLFLDSAGSFRLLRSVKNRNGPTTAVDPLVRGLFQMTPLGLASLTPTDQLADERAYRAIPA